MRGARKRFLVFVFKTIFEFFIWIKKRCFELLIFCFLFFKFVCVFLILLDICFYLTFGKKTKQTNMHFLCEYYMIFALTYYIKKQIQRWMQHLHFWFFALAKLKNSAEASFFWNGRLLSFVFLLQHSWEQ